jgi:hypothetical protein
MRSTMTSDAPAHPARFVAALADERKRFLLRHLPRLADVLEPVGDVRALIEEGLIEMRFGKLEVTEAGRKFLEM